VTAGAAVFDACRPRTSGTLGGMQDAPMHDTDTATDADEEAPGVAWLVCPACGVQVAFESCHTRCPRCHTLVESCSDGGRL
jgi:hypothetical protein